MDEETAEILEETAELKKKFQELLEKKMKFDAALKAKNEVIEQMAQLESQWQKDL